MAHSQHRIVHKIRFYKLKITYIVLLHISITLELKGVCEVQQATSLFMRFMINIEVQHWWKSSPNYNTIFIRSKFYCKTQQI